MQRNQDPNAYEPEIVKTLKEREEKVAKLKQIRLIEEEKKKAKREEDEKHEKLDLHGSDNESVDESEEEEESTSMGGSKEKPTRMVTRETEESA